MLAPFLLKTLPLSNFQACSPFRSHRNIINSGHELLQPLELIPQLPFGDILFSIPVGTQARSSSPCYVTVIVFVTGVI
jgi:hypothetical protein